MRLKSRSLQIPNGYFFRQPEIKWDSRSKLPMHSSFDTVVRALISARQANPHYVQKHNWPTDFNTVSDEVDAFNTKVVMMMPGGARFVTDPGGGAPPPFYQAPSPQQQNALLAAASKARKLWSGIKSGNDWIDSGEPAVAQEEAERRASVCVACPLNGQGGLEKFFTVPAAEAIRRQFSKIEGRQLATSQDDKLGICDACFCPMKLKVFTPMKFVKAHLTDAVIDELCKGNNCWIVAAL